MHVQLEFRARWGNCQSGHWSSQKFFASFATLSGIWIGSSTASGRISSSPLPLIKGSRVKGFGNVVGNILPYSTVLTRFEDDMRHLSSLLFRDHHYLTSLGEIRMVNIPPPDIETANITQSWVGL
jgi:hypothetical protein